MVPIILSIAVLTGAAVVSTIICLLITESQDF